MELMKGPERATGSLADYRRNLVNRIVQQTVTELAQEKGITPDARRRWLKLVARTEETASAFEETLLPAEQAILIPILGKEEEPKAEGPKS
jgi:hypothetical protein